MIIPQDQIYTAFGRFDPNCVLTLADHAGKELPKAENLGIEHSYLSDHIAYDIGIQPFTRAFLEGTHCSAIMSRYSRLWVDLNRRPLDADVIPKTSDGIEIVGNKLSLESRLERLDKYFHPYHDHIERLIDQIQPRMIVSFHSFTPRLHTKPDELRPWEIGILYGKDERAAKIMLEALEDSPVQAGDQQPYSGRIYNATMDRHAEARGIPYMTIELRQDLINYKEGQERFVQILHKKLSYVLMVLGLDPAL